MIRNGDAVLAGVSGGADSVALACVLKSLIPRYQIKNLAIAHLNHGLRGKASDGDALFVQKLAKKLNLDCFVEKTAVRKYQKERGLSLEEAARKVRYAFFDRIAKDKAFNKIALGHHLDDNAELVLMNLLRGSGPLGISGIPPARSGNIIRPFYNLSKKQITAFLVENKIDHTYDASNEDNRFLRNKVRNELIPLLIKSYNPNISQGLHRSADILRKEDQWMNTAVTPFYENCIIKKKAGGIVLSVSFLMSMHGAMKRRIIRKAIQEVKGNLRKITFTHVDSIIGLLTSRKASARLDLPDGIRLHLSYDSFEILRGHSGKRQSLPQLGDAVPYSYEISKPDRDKTIVHIQETDSRLTLFEVDRSETDKTGFSGQNRAYFDMETLTFPLKVRGIKPGDRFSPFGVKGTQKIKKYFINHKIPKSERVQTPVLLSAERIIWLVGHQIDNFVKITQNTSRILCAEFSLRKKQ